MDHLPPGQQLVAPGKWPIIGERTPAESREPWTLSIDGQVQQPTCWSLEELQSLASVERTIDLHCVTRWSRLGMHFRGVPLQKLLDEVQPHTNARFVSFVARSERNHSTSLALADLAALEPLVAWEADGQPLSSEHGGPLRLIVPGRYLYKSLKWLTRIELLTEDRLGYWESAAGYHNHADPWQQQRYIATGLTRTEIQRLLTTRDLSQQDLRGFAGAGHELDGLVARNAILRDADFQNASLRAACFDGANLSNAHFAVALLQGASFVGSDLEGADFTGADLRGADFSGAALTAVTFVDALADPAKAPHAATMDATTKIDRQSLGDLMPAQLDFVLRMLQR